MTFQEPTIESRDEQRYVAIRAETTLHELGSKLPPLLSDVSEWMDERHIAAAGPPLFRYLVIDGGALTMEVDVGFPVSAPVSGSARVESRLLPAGRYATALHTGPYARIRETIAALRSWAEDNGVRWDLTVEGQREYWAARVESYVTGPEQEADPKNWQTELAFRVADE